jgi:hypothetical protein
VAFQLHQAIHSVLANASFAKLGTWAAAVDTVHMHVPHHWQRLKGGIFTGEVCQREGVG